METNQQALAIGVIVALLSAFTIIRNINDIIALIKRLLNEYVEFWRLKNEKQRTELQEQRLRVAFWMRAIQTGHAEEKLEQIEKGSRKDGKNHS